MFPFELHDSSLRTPGRAAPGQMILHLEVDELAERVVAILQPIAVDEPGVEVARVGVDGTEERLLRSGERSK